MRTRSLICIGEAKPGGADGCETVCERAGLAPEMASPRYGLRTCDTFVTYAQMGGIDGISNGGK